MVPEPMHTDALSSAFQPLLFRDGVLCMPCLFTAGHAGLGEVHLILAGAAVALLVAAAGVHVGYLTPCEWVPRVIHRGLPWVPLPG
jgi:hypothetical protein